MSERPRPPEQPILPGRSSCYLVIIGLVMAACTLGTIWWATDQYGDAVARTMGVTVFSLANIWFALETSDPKRSHLQWRRPREPRPAEGHGSGHRGHHRRRGVGLLNRLLGTVSLTIDQWVISVVGLSRGRGRRRGGKAAQRPHRRGADRGREARARRGLEPGPGFYRDPLARPSTQAPSMRLSRALPRFSRTIQRASGSSLAARCSKRPRPRSGEATMATLQA